MSIFDKTYKSTAVTYSPQNEQEAWLAIMHACIAVDDDVADAELEELAQILASKALFEGHDVRAYYKTILYAHAQIGSKRLIDNSVEKISPDNKANLFAVTIELLLADGLIAEKEEELITYVYSALELDTAVAKNIIQTFLAKIRENRDNNFLKDNPL